MIALLITMAMYANAEVPKVTCWVESFKKECNTCTSAVCTDGTIEWVDQTHCTMAECVYILGKKDAIGNQSNNHVCDWASNGLRPIGLQQEIFALGRIDRHL